MDDERDAEDANRGLLERIWPKKGIDFMLSGQRLSREHGSGGSGGSRRSSTNARPSKALFVINFEPYHTRTRDLERHFYPYGKIMNVRIRRNFAFVQYKSEDDVSRALKATNMSKLMDRVISVEYAVRDDDERRNGYSPGRSHDRSLERGHDRLRSPSPYCRESASPDYGHCPSLYKRERGSPDYGRGRSPCHYRTSRTSAD